MPPDQDPPVGHDDGLLEGGLVGGQRHRLGHRQRRLEVRDRHALPEPAGDQPRPRGPLGRILVAQHDDQDPVQPLRAVAL